MTKLENKRLTAVRDLASDLLNRGSTGSGIRNIDVLEALLADVTDVQYGREPKELAKLNEQDLEYV